MKRNKKLILKILRFLRDNDGGTDLPDFNGYTAAEVQYHIDLCQEAGFVRLTESSLMDEPSRYLLTWAGHDMLEANCDG